MWSPNSVQTPCLATSYLSLLPRGVTLDDRFGKPLFVLCEMGAIILMPMLGIERLKRKGQPREHRRSWKAVKETFGGDFSLNWFNPFSTPCQPETPSDKDLVRQGPSLSDIDITDTTTTTEEPSEETKDEDSVEVIDE